MTVCDVNDKKSLVLIGSIRLQSVKVVGRIGYLNSDPAFPFMLPFVAWKANELADQIMRACVDYDMAASWINAKALALKIVKDITKQTYKRDFANDD